MSLVADRRRFSGPESNPLLRLPSTVQPVASTSQRPDGRAAGDVRPIFLEPGLVAQASGSAFIEAGQTKLICAVCVYSCHHRNAKARLNVEVRFAPFACRTRRRAPGKDTESPELSALLAQALAPAVRLDLMPKSTIDVFVTILECDGHESDPSLAVTAASAALADAGVEMYGLVAGASAGISAEFRILLDPTHSELASCSNGLLHLGYLPALGTTTLVSFEGALDRTTLQQVMNRLKGVCEQVHHVLVKRLTVTGKMATGMV